MNLPMDLVRAAFPALALADAGVPRCYLDAPAGRSEEHTSELQSPC